MDRHDWDERYQGESLVWSAEPNRFLVAEVEGLTPGRALDVACGEGRNAIWLAEQGWTVTGVDFSEVGLDKARRLAAARGVSVPWELADVTEYTPAREHFDLVIVLYLHLPEGPRRVVFEPRRRRGRARRDPARGGTRHHQPGGRLGRATGAGRAVRTRRRRRRPHRTRHRQSDTGRTSRVHRRGRQDRHRRPGARHSATSARRRDLRPFPSRSSATTWRCRASTACTGATSTSTAPPPRTRCPRSPRGSTSSSPGTRACTAAPATSPASPPTPTSTPAPPMLRFAGRAADGDDIAIICRNTTEAINHLAYRLRLEPDDVVVTTVVEHHANLLPWARVARRRFVECDADGTFDRRRRRGGARRRTTSEAAGHHRRVERHRLDAPDRRDRRAPPTSAASPSSSTPPSSHPTDRLPPSVDFVAWSGHKMYAPFGAGALVGPRRTFADGDPFLAGGGAVDLVDLDEVVWTDPPEREEAGSPNVLGAVALARRHRRARPHRLAAPSSTTTSTLAAPAALRARRHRRRHRARPRPRHADAAHRHLHRRRRRTTRSSPPG